MSAERGQWASKFGFVMAAAGSAVGLGNIWRFPYLTGQNGGAAFVFIYILCVVFVGAPVLMNEMALGRLTGKNTIGAFRTTGANKLYMFFGAVLALCVSFFVLSYYTVIAGWTIGYMCTSVINSPIPFKDFIAAPEYVLPLFALAMLTTIIIVLGGISGGIEKATRIMMPLLFVLLIVIIIRSLTLPGSGAGVEYYLVPDFSKITGGVVLKALTQAFFSLGIGWGIIITYGSYLPKDQSIVSSSLWVGAMDTSVALLGGLMVFPAVFAFGMEPGSGPTLVFEVLANIFPSMPFGNIAGAFFYLLLFIAAITSTISMVEVVGSWLIDDKRWTRKKATWTVGIAAFVVGIPSALSNGTSPTLTNLQFMGAHGMLDIMDFLFGTMAMLIVVFTTCLYTGWAIKTDRIIDEISLGSPYFNTKKVLGILPSTLWKFFIRVICPLVIILVISNQIGIF
ncbi:MAG: sodium-dependent transporter [Cyclobacteriaceae bacterium]|nr:sodium-dependent transporter [Cyclobacteriaceae bacterium]